MSNLIVKNYNDSLLDFMLIFCHCCNIETATVLANDPDGKGDGHALTGDVPGKGKPKSLDNSPENRGLINKLTGS